MNSSGILNFVLIGAKSSGKTMYLGTLFGEKLIQSTDSETTKYLSSIWDKIDKKDKITGERNCKVPPTPGMLKILNFSYQHNKWGRLEFSIDDYDGSFTEAMSKDDPNTKKERDQLLKSIKSSEGCIFFLPLEKSAERFQYFAEEIDAFIKMAQFSSSSKSPIPASIIVTKWDESDFFQSENEEEKALKFIQDNDHLRRTFEAIKKNFKHTTVIPISSCKNYNLTKPIDYSLENTFRQWHEKSTEYSDKQEHRKLVKYLAKRYFDIKLNDEYNFTTLYDMAQEKYFEEVKKEYEIKQGLIEKEEYINDVSQYFKTKIILFKPLYDDIKIKKRAIKLKKSKNIILSVLIVMFVVIALIEYKNKLSVDEAFDVIVDRTQNEDSYQNLENEINIFLDKYDNVNFLYAFAEVPKKRAEVLKMKSTLLIKYKQDIEDKKKKILDSQNLTPDEKKRAISRLDVIDSEKDVIENIQKELRDKKVTEQWNQEVNGCLKTCISEGDLGTIENLLSRYKSDVEIIQDKETETKVKALYVRKRDIGNKVSLEEELNKIKNITNLDGIATFVSDIESDIFRKKIIKEQIISKIIKVNEKDYKTQQGVKLISELKTKHTKDNIKSFIESDLKKFTYTKQRYREVLKDIEHVEKYLDLQNINYESYKNFEDFEQANINTKLNAKLTDFLNDLKEKKPKNDSLTQDIKIWLKKVNQFDEFIINKNGFIYKYTIPEEIKDEIDNTESKNNKIAHIEDHGLNNIVVSLQGKEENTLGFQCGSEDEIIITVFNQILHYDSMEDCTDNNILTFSTGISIRDRHSYVTIIEKDSTPYLDSWAGEYVNDKVSGDIYLDLNELYDLSENNIKIEKKLDDNKLILIFKK